MLGAIETLTAQGRHSLHGVADHAGCVEVPWAVAGIDPFFNVNSPEDIIRAEAHISPET